MNGYYGYGYAHPYGSDPYAIVGQNFDPTPPRLQAYAKHAQRLVTAMAAQRPTTPFFVWILDADGREYVHPFSSRDEMGALLRRKSQPSRNFYYMALFNRTGPVWPAPESTAYGCHAPEWNTWPSEFPPQPGPCPSTVSGWPWWSVVGQTAAAQHLAAAQPAMPEDLAFFLTQETNERFWQQTAYKPGKKLDMSNPNDRKMARVWLDIYVDAEADFEAGRPMLTAAAWTALRMTLATAGLGVGQCGTRSYARVTPQIKDTLLAKLRAEGMVITGDNPWDIDTRQYNVKLRAIWDPRAQVLKLIVTAGRGGYFGLVACHAIWEKIDPLMKGTIGALSRR